MQIINSEDGDKPGDFGRTPNQNVSSEILVNLSFVEREKLVEIKN